MCIKVFNQDLDFNESIIFLYQIPASTKDKRGCSVLILASNFNWSKLLVWSLSLLAFFLIRFLMFSGSMSFISVFFEEILYPSEKVDTINLDHCWLV